jgi:type I restriction enzyme S subunit
MNAELLLAHFDRISDAPDAVPRLRRYILDLAVRGKLVEQDPSYEPASELLKRIQTEKARLLRAGNTRKAPPLSRFEEDEAPFCAPLGWKWTRVRQITSDRGQTTPNREFTYIDVTSINKEAGCIADAKVLAAADAPSRARKLVQTGDVLYSCVRPYLLNIAVVEAEINPAPVASTAFAVLNGFGLVISRYMWIVLRSPFMVECVESKMRGQAYPAINDSDFAELPFPLPPLAEQHRIVAKVDELMALCDRLEATQRERESRRDQFAASTHHRLNNGADAEDLRSHAQFFIGHLPRLTVRPDQVKQLRQTILNLAVQGELVPQIQEPNSSSSLLVELREIQEKNDSRTKHSAVDDSDPKFIQHLPASLPNGWIACPMEELFRFVDYRGRTPTRTASGVRLITAKNVRMGHVANNPVEFIDKQAYKAWMTRGFPENGDLLFVTEGATMGYVGTIEFKFVFALAQRTIDLQPYLRDCSRFFLFTLMSPMFQQAILTNSTGTAVKGIKAAKLKRIRVPLPPRAEQLRIIAKVDELMAMCDQLESRLTTAQTEAARLLASVLHHALQNPGLD